MATNMVETVNKIKSVGANNVRTVPMPGQPVTGGLYQIEIMENSTWSAIAIGLPQTTANDLIRQAMNRTICG